MLISFAFVPVDWGINRKRCGKFRLKCVIADRPDLCALAMFPHNSQLTLTLERPQRPVPALFPCPPENGAAAAGAGGAGPAPSSMI